VAGLKRSPWSVNHVADDVEGAVDYFDDNFQYRR
jgi:hypothetical protein